MWKRGEGEECWTMLKDNLIMLRNLHGYSQEEVAEKIGISRQAYGKWEKGETVPDIEKGALLAEVYGITVDCLLNTKPLEDGTKIPPPRGKHIFGTVTVSEDGQITIPKQACDLFELCSGDRLIVLGDENEGIAFVKEKMFMERMNQVMDRIREV